MNFEIGFFILLFANSFLLGLAQAFYRLSKRWEAEAWRKTRMCAWYQVKLSDSIGEHVADDFREFAEQARNYGRLEDQ